MRQAAGAPSWLNEGCCAPPLAVRSDRVSGSVGETAAVGLRLWRGCLSRPGLIAILTLLLTAGCGSSAAPTASTNANAITGAASCPTAEQQDLTFTGDLTGHLQCATSTPACGQARNLLANGVSVDLDFRLGAKAIQFLIAFGHGDPGSYPAGTLGDESSSSLDGATLDGDGHWQTPVQAGTMTVAKHDKQGASGSIDITLKLAPKSAHVSGTWQCIGAATD